MQIPSTSPYQSPTHIYPKTGHLAGPKETAPANADLVTEGATTAAKAINAASAAPIHKALAALPSVRPEAVAKGKELLSDPTYPPLVIINKLANLFVTDAQHGAASKP